MEHVKFKFATEKQVMDVIYVACDDPKYIMSRFDIDHWPEEIVLKLKILKDFLRSIASVSSARSGETQLLRALVFEMNINEFFCECERFLGKFIVPAKLRDAMLRAQSQGP